MTDPATPPLNEQLEDLYEALGVPSALIQQLELTRVITHADALRTQELLERIARALEAATPPRARSDFHVRPPHAKGGTP